MAAKKQRTTKQKVASAKAGIMTRKQAANLARSRGMGGSGG